MTEERSAAELLRGLIPRLFPGREEPTDWIAIPHEGKQDLEKSIPKKLRAWNEPQARFLILRDSDSADCREVKTRLLGLMPATRTQSVLVRVAVRELESWYLGDLAAVEAFSGRSGLAAMQSKAQYRDPESNCIAIGGDQKSARQLLQDT